MVLSQFHSEEIFWLKRRMQFLFELDQLQRRQAPTEEIMALVEDFRKVEKPEDLVARLAEIYGLDAFNKRDGDQSPFTS